MTRTTQATDRPERVVAVFPTLADARSAVTALGSAGYRRVRVVRVSSPMAPALRASFAMRSALSRVLWIWGTAAGLLVVALAFFASGRSLVGVAASTLALLAASTALAVSWRRALLERRRALVLCRVNDGARRERAERLLRSAGALETSSFVIKYIVPRFGA